jgi:molecular chaperone GrpE
MANDDDKPARGANGGTPPDAAAPEGAEPPPQQPTFEDVLTELEKQVATLEQQNKEQHDRLLRTAADFENWKKRAKKEQDEAQARGREQLAKELLPVLDNFERALQHAPEKDPLAQGVRMVEKQLLAALEKFGITRFSAVGQAFDPSLHDAIQQVETTELAPGMVAQEFASGYMSGGRLLRAAMVAVAKAPAAPEPSGANGSSGG